jgi:hypothetical protein
LHELTATGAGGSMLFERGTPGLGERSVEIIS